MRRRRFVMLGYGLLAALTVTASGCAAVLIGGAVGAGAVAGYAYYKGDVHFDFAAPFSQTWAAALAALQDLNLPISSQNMQTDHGEILSRGPEGEKVELFIEPEAGPNGPVTRVHVRVGVFGSQALSQQIHAQISNRLQNLPPPSPLAPGVNSPVPLGPPVPGSAPPVAAMPAETAAPPLAGTPETVVPVSRPGGTGTVAIPVSNSQTQPPTK